MALELRPLSVTAARVEVKRLHRHLKRMVGGLFGASVYVDGALVGVGVASAPKAPRSRDGFTVEITRVATDGHRNACSRLYGALLRAASSVGYRKAITFTRLEEPGTSLLAAGWVDDGITREQAWFRDHNPKRSEELSQVRRWVKDLREPKTVRRDARRVATARAA